MSVIFLLKSGEKVGVLSNEENISDYCGRLVGLIF